VVPFVCRVDRAWPGGGAALFAAEKAVIHLEHATLFSTAPEVFFLKNQGLAFQRAAARAPNVLPIYGSSELIVPAVPEKGNNFFEPRRRVSSFRR
jgi:hypothetical protein